VIIEESSLQTEVESVNTSSIKQQMLNEFRCSKEYRHAFIDEAIRTRIAAQITALRNNRGWDYKMFAQELNKKVSWVYRLEDPNANAPTIPSLLEVASAFDIGLDVRFRPFSDLLDDVTTLKPGSFSVPSFGEELRDGSFSQPKRKRKIRSPQRTKSHRSGKQISHPELERKVLGTSLITMPAALAA